MQNTISVLRDFTKYPGPRYREDGPFSGQQFREEIVQPRLKQAIEVNQTLRVVLDGVAGYGSSFLEEAFGGLVRSGFDPRAVEEHLEIVAETTRFRHHRLRAIEYISEATANERAVGIPF